MEQYGSSPQDPQVAKNGKTSSARYSKPLTAKEIAAISDEEIDFSDIPELDDEFWEKAEMVLPENKERITLRLDKAILEHFRAEGRGYQTRINAVLSSFVAAQKNNG